jgi:hypothetical protein
MQKFIRIIIILALIAIGIWIWRILFPNPEKMIRSQLDKLATSVSFPSNQGVFAKSSYPQKLADFFTTNVEITVNGPGREQHSLNGRENLVQTATEVRWGLRGLDVKFVDINVVLAPDRQSATANLTAEVKASSDQSLDAQELKFTFQKAGRKWLIRRVETVKTFTQRDARASARA